MDVKVSLSEVLEVRDRPLDEAEIWAVMCHSVEALQDLFIQSDIEGIHNNVMEMFPITPHSLLLCSNGCVLFGPSSSSDVRNREFIPPEFANFSTFTEDEVERMFVFSLGMTLLTTAKFHLMEALKPEISQELNRLLRNLCSEEPMLRSTLFEVLRTCNSSRFRHKDGALPSSHFTKKLYRTVLGSNEDMFCWVKEKNNDLVSPSESKYRSSSSTYGSRSQLKSRPHFENSYSPRQDSAMQKLKHRSGTVGLGGGPRDELSDSGHYSLISTNGHFLATDHPHAFKSKSNVDLSQSNINTNHDMSRSRHTQPQNRGNSRSKVQPLNDERVSGVSRNVWLPVFQVHNNYGALEHAYERLNRRRTKLDVLRREVFLDRRDLDHAFSMESDTETATLEPQHTYRSPAEISSSGQQTSPVYNSWRSRSRNDERLRKFAALDSENEKLVRKELEIEHWRQNQMQYFRPLTVETSSQISLDFTDTNSLSYKVRKRSSSAAGSHTGHHERRNNNNATRRSSGTTTLPRIDSGASYHGAAPFDRPSGRFASEDERLSALSSPVHDEDFTNIDSTDASPRTTDSTTNIPSNSFSTKHSNALHRHEHENDELVDSCESTIHSSFDRANSLANSPTGNPSPSSVRDFLVQSPDRRFMNKPSPSSRLINNDKTVIRSGSVAENILLKDRPTVVHRPSEQSSDDTLHESFKKSSNSVRASSSKSLSHKNSEESRVELPSIEPPVLTPRRKLVVQPQDSCQNTAADTTVNGSSELITAKQQQPDIEDQRIAESRDVSSPVSSDLASSDDRHSGTHLLPAEVDAVNAGHASDKSPVFTRSELDASSLTTATGESSLGSKLVPAWSQKTQVDPEPNPMSLMYDSRGPNMKVENVNGNSRNSADKDLNSADYRISGPQLPVSRINSDAKAPLIKRRELLRPRPVNHVSDQEEEFADLSGNASDSSLESYVKNNAIENITKFIAKKSDSTGALTWPKTSKNADPDFVNKPDKTENFTDSPAEPNAAEVVEPFVVTKPDNVEIFTDLPEAMNDPEYIKPYIVSKPVKIEEFTDSPLAAPAPESVEPYIVLKPENTEVFIDSPVKSLILPNSEPYTISQTNKVEVFTSLPANVTMSNSEDDNDATLPSDLHLSHYVGPHTKQDNVEIINASSVRTHEPSPSEPYLLTRPEHVEVFTNSEEPKPPDFETYTISAVGSKEVFDNVALSLHSHESGDSCEDLANKSFDVKAEPSAENVIDQDSVATVISNGDDIKDMDDNKKDPSDVIVDMQIEPPVTMARKSSDSLITDTLPSASSHLVDGEKSHDAVEPERKPPPKAPRKLFRASANDVPEHSETSSDVRNIATKNDQVGGSDIQDCRSVSIDSTRHKINDVTDDLTAPLKDSFPGADENENNHLLETKMMTPEPDIASAENKTRSGLREQEIDVEETPVPTNLKKHGHIVGNKAPRAFYGPEFANPDQQLATLIVPEAGGAQESDLRHVLIILLDGAHLDLICSVDSNGKHLYDCVAAYLSLPEKILFGLVYVQDGEYFFIYPDAKVHKVAPADWKKNSKSGQRQSTNFVLYFHVKFYITDFNQLRHRQTRHLFYLQLRHDLLDGSLHVTNELALVLGSLAMQAEYGDWHEKAADSDVKHYLPSAIVRSLGERGARAELLRQHLRYKGMPDAKAEWLLMQKCVQLLPEYGLHLHKLFRTEKINDETLLVGVGIHCMSLAEENRNQIHITRQHPWNTIYKISFNKHRFSIATKTATSSGSDALVKYNYYTSSYKKGQYLVWLSTEHHHFKLSSQLSRNVKPRSMPSFLLEDEEYLLTDEASSVAGSVASLNAEDDNNNENKTAENNGNISSNINNNNNSRNIAEGRQSVHEEPGVDLEADDQMSNVGSGLELENDVPPQGLSRHPSSKFSKRGMQKETVKSYDSSSIHEQGHNQLRKNSAYDLSNDDRQLQLGEQYNVVLTKKENSFGLNIAGGANMNTHNDGVYVKSMPVGGAAEQDGRIHVGDRILEVNGISLVGTTHRQAVGILRSSPLTSSLVLERRDPPSVTPSISPWSSLARSELEINAIDGETFETDDKLQKPRLFSVSQSGIQPELSGYHGDLDPDQTAIDENVHGFTSFKNRSGRRYASEVAPYSSSAVRKQEGMILNASNDADQKYAAGWDEEKVEGRETEWNETLRDKALPQAWGPARASPQQTNSISSRQMWNSSRALSELDGDAESSVFESSSGYGSKVMHRNTNIGFGRSGYGGLNSFELGTDEEEYPSFINHRDIGRTGLTENVTEDGPAEEKFMAGNEDQFDFVPLNRKKILPTLPENLSDDWLESLPVITINPDSQNYSDSKLELMILDLKDRLERGEPTVEFKSLRQMKQTDLCLLGLETNNKHKNRYRNILPYDKTRVRLSGTEDYVNASHINFKVGQHQLHYIATQGPLQGTITAFWTMAWEQNVDVIVMLTREIEDGRVKCERYWPELQDGHVFLGNLYCITQLECHILSSCIVRIFQMDDLECNTSRLITHLNFTAWPDHSTPQDDVTVLEFIRLMHCVHNDSNTILVHCSAGIGRTGALMTIDICISLIENDLRFDIESIVRELRQQRHGMIQTQDQYRFCYMTILMLLENLQSDAV